jgi:hypothetical protein
MKDGAHTHGTGGGIGAALAIGLGAVLAASIAGPVAAAVGELVRLVVIAVAVILGLGVAAVVALLVYRVRHRRAIPPPPVLYPPPPARPVQARTHPQAIERPAVHLHFHGITAEDVAAILGQHGDG